jgi:lysophospholipase L1-like esterase
MHGILPKSYRAHSLLHRKRLSNDCFLKRCACFIALIVLLCCCSPINREEDQLFLEQFSGIRLCIIGDSISTFKDYQVSDKENYEGTDYAYYYPRGDVRSLKDIWWYKVADKLGIPLSRINNCSWSGSTVTGDALSITNAYAGCSTRRIQDLAFNGLTPDIILCFISCNDWGRNVPLGYWDRDMQLEPSSSVTSFSEAYAIMLSRIKSYFPDASVFCMTNLVDRKRESSPGWPAENSNGVTVEEWNSAMMEISKSFDCYIIDVNDCGITYDNLFKYVVDNGLHPNAAGMTLIANKVLKNISDVYINDDVE